MTLVSQNISSTSGVSCIQNDIFLDIYEVLLTNVNLDPEQRVIGVFCHAYTNMLIRDRYNPDTYIEDHMSRHLKFVNDCFKQAKEV